MLSKHSPAINTAPLTTDSFRRWSCLKRLIMICSVRKVQNQLLLLLPSHTTSNSNVHLPGLLCRSCSDKQNFKLIPFEKYSFIWNKMRLVALFTAGAVVSTHMTVVAGTSIIIFTADLLCRSNGSLSQVQEVFAFCDWSSPGSVLWRVSAVSSQAKWEQHIWEALTTGRDLTRGLLLSNFYLVPWDGRGVGNKSSFGLEHVELAQWWGRSQPFQAERRQDENKQSKHPVPIKCSTGATATYSSSLVQCSV